MLRDDRRFSAADIRARNQNLNEGFAAMNPAD